MYVVFYICFWNACVAYTHYDMSATLNAMNVIDLEMVCSCWWSIIRFQCSAHHLSCVRATEKQQKRDNANNNIVHAHTCALWTLNKTIKPNGHTYLARVRHHFQTPNNSEMRLSFSYCCLFLCACWAEGVVFKPIRTKSRWIIFMQSRQLLL